MRKLFWCCTASGALVVAGVFTAAHHAARHPGSFIGRVMHGASHVAASATPYTGIAPVVATVHSAPAKDEVAIDADGVPADPVPEDEKNSSPIETPKSAAPIVINEDEKPAAAPMPFESGVECPAGKDTQTAPPTMPPAEGFEESEAVLPMPTVVEEEQERPTTGCFFTKVCDVIRFRAGWCGWFRGGAAAPAKDCGKCEKASEGCAEESEPAPAGKSSGGGEEASEEGSRARSSALKAIRKIRSRMTEQEESPRAGPRVDTMEYRPSDRPLSDYGPGPL